MVLNYMWNWIFFRRSYFGSKSWFCNSAYIGICIKFKGRNLYIFQSSTVKLKLAMWEIGFTKFLNMHKEITFKNYNHSDTKGLSYSWCACIRTLHKNSVISFGQRKLCIFKPRFACSQISLWYKLWYRLRNLVNLSQMHTWHFIDLQYYFTDCKGSIN